MKTNKKSFTLVEVLMAMGVFLFACSAMFGVLMRSTKQNVDSTKLKQASMVAARLMAKIQEDGYNGLGGAANAVKRDEQYTKIMYKIEHEPLQGGDVGRYILNLYFKFKLKEGAEAPIESSDYIPVDETKPDQVYTMLVTKRS